MKVIPVRPRRLTTASGLSTSLLPAKANWTSRHSIPASPSARRTASAPMWIADFPEKRPNGWRPPPTIATSYIVCTSCDGHERVEPHVVSFLVGGERDDRHLELLPDHGHAIVEAGQTAL